MEDPQALAGAHVEGAHEAFHVGLAARDAAGAVRRADDDGVVGDHGRGVQANFAGDRIDHLIVILLQIHQAVLAEGGDARAGLGVQRDQAVARA